jgi:hypothetical protein
MLSHLERWLSQREECGASVDDPADARVGEEKSDTIRMVRGGEFGNIPQPADERLWVTDTCSDVDEPGEPRTV